jgi:hypothetical protein
MPSRPPRIAVGLAACLVALAVASCDGPGNSGQWRSDPSIIGMVPWENGVVPDVDAQGNAVVPLLPVYPPIASGMPDPGSERINCAPLAGLEFAKPPAGAPIVPRAGWFDDFEPTTSDPSENGGAPGWASYDDLTKYSFHAPGDFTWYPGLMGTIDWEWGLPSEMTPGPSCDVTPNNWVMHFRGGEFRNWGGGVSHAFTDPVGSYRPTPFDACAAGVDFCPAPLAPTATVDSAGLPTTAPDGSTYLQSHDFFDVSKWDGIAFWARRGPEGHDTALIILTDKFTSSRLARQNQKYCRRYRQCYPTCLSGTPCSPVLDPGATTPTYRCFDPATGPFPPIQIDSQRDLMYPRCGQSACTSPTTYLDPDFDGKACSPYAFPAADESGYYCWNPGQDPPPAGRDERCQDGWQTSVQLAPDWTFYALPWSQFGQVGFGKKAPYMDLKSIDTIAFGATMGWADVYFDNVTLYRRTQ